MVGLSSNTFFRPLSLPLTLGPENVLRESLGLGYLVVTLPSCDLGYKVSKNQSHELPDGKIWQAELTVIHNTDISNSNY